MKLTEADIVEYKALVKARFGRDISNEQALEDALSLIQFVKLAYKPITPITKNNIKTPKSVI